VSAIGLTPTARLSDYGVATDVANGVNNPAAQASGGRESAGCRTPAEFLLGPVG